MGYVAAARLTAVHQRHHLHLSESSRARPQLSPPSAPPEPPPQSLTQLSPQAASPPPSSVLTLGQVNPWSADLLPDSLSILERAQGRAEPLLDRRPLTNETQGQLALDFEREFSPGLWSCAFPKASVSQGALFYHFKESYWPFGFFGVSPTFRDGWVMKHHLEQSVAGIRAWFWVREIG